MNRDTWYSYHLISTVSQKVSNNDFSNPTTYYFMYPVKALNGVFDVNKILKEINRVRPDWVVSILNRIDVLESEFEEYLVGEKGRWLIEI